MNAYWKRQRDKLVSQIPLKNLEEFQTQMSMTTHQTEFFQIIVIFQRLECYFLKTGNQTIIY